MVSISASDFFHDMLLFLGLRPNCFFYNPLISFSLSRPFAQGLSIQAIQDLYNLAEAINWGVVNVPLTELQWMYNYKLKYNRWTEN
jgi:hypothetical protein